MKHFTTFAVIAISLLVTTACKPAQDGPAQNPPAQDTVATLDSQQNAAAPAVNEPQPEPSVVQNPSDDATAKVVEELPPEPPDPSGYVDIAAWCRPGMSHPITAQEWAKANNAFGLKFLGQTEGNTVFSPYSIERALGMTLDGACATTATEMLATLELPNARRLSLSGRDVDDAMKSVNADTMLEIDNTLWPDKSLTLPEDFLARISAGYRNKTVALDYGADPEKARIIINNDIAKTTHNRIMDLIPKGIITPATRLVLTNAVYFKSKWASPFQESATKTEQFYNADKPIETTIMHQTGYDSRVCIAKDYAIYDLPFDSSKGDDKGEYVMRIVLPTIDDTHPMEKRMELLEDVEKQLSGDIVSNCRYQFFNDVYVAMPKFKLAPDTISIKTALQSMGMNKAFSEQAEFYAMPNTTPKPSDPSNYLMIDDVLHKAFIEINEKGGEAAAATAVVMTSESERIGPPPTSYYFTVDHPFIYMIIEKSTGAAIFMGRVTDL